MRDDPLSHARINTFNQPEAVGRLVSSSLRAGVPAVSIDALDVDGIAGVLWHGYRAILGIHPPPAQYGATERPQYMAEVTRSFWHADDGNNQTESSDGFYSSLIEAARSAAHAFISRFGPPDLSCEEHNDELHHQ